MTDSKEPFGAFVVTNSKDVTHVYITRSFDQAVSMAISDGLIRGGSESHGYMDSNFNWRFTPKGAFALDNNSNYHHEHLDRYPEVAKTLQIINEQYGTSRPYGRYLKGPYGVSVGGHPIVEMCPRYIALKEQSEQSNRIVTLLRQLKEEIE